MELPHIGIHCGVHSCSKLDFLPFECDCCHKTFCGDHRGYGEHNCTESYMKDVHVPICPLCNTPISVQYGQDPNVSVNEHIMRDCHQQQNKKLYTNKCSFPGCRKKELVPVTCNKCHKNYCLKHRMERDHSCSSLTSTSPPLSSTGRGPPLSSTGRGPPLSSAGRGPPLSSTGRGPPLSSTATSHSTGRSKRPQISLMSQIGAELNRERQDRRNTSTATNNNMSDDESLALALALSEQDNKTPPPPPPSTTEEEDEELAKAIEASLQETSKDKSNCIIS